MISRHRGTSCSEIQYWLVLPWFVTLKTDLHRSDCWIKFHWRMIWSGIYFPAAISSPAQHHTSHGHAYAHPRGVWCYVIAVAITPHRIIISLLQNIIQSIASSASHLFCMFILLANHFKNWNLDDAPAQLEGASDQFQVLFNGLITK